MAEKERRAAARSGARRPQGAFPRGSLVVRRRPVASGHGGPHRPAPAGVLREVLGRESAAMFCEIVIVPDAANPALAPWFQDVGFSSLDQLVKKAAARRCAVGPGIRVPPLPSQGCLARA